LYQSIYYDRDKTSSTKYHYYLRDDVKGIKCFQYWPTVYKLDEDGEFETLFGDRCSPIQGRYDREDPTILEKDIDRELVLLRDLYYKTDEIPKFHNTVYLDIEIEIIGALNPTTIREANAEVTAIALIDLNTKQKICFILDKKEEIKSIDSENKIIVSCKSEKVLLSKFLNKWEQIDPTIAVGYNSDFFDIPYLYYRIKKVLGNDVYRLSPIGKIDENIYQPESPIKIGLVNCLDFMLLFKKYVMKEEPSYKLGDIGIKYAKLGKIEYNGSLDKLFKEDPNKFIEYNLRDVEIIEALEDKLKFIQLTILISHLCHTPYESIYYNTALNEGAILTYLKRKNIVAPNKPTTTNPSIKELEVGDHIIHQRGTPTVEGYIYSIEGTTVTIKTISNQYIQRSIRTVKKKDSYAGGYLLDPIPGLYSNISDLDFTSLYPSIIKTLNLGIETLVGRIVTKNNYEQNNSLKDLKLRDPNEEIEIEKLNHTTYKLKRTKITVGKLITYIISNKWSISASGAFYRTDIKSISCEVLEDWFNKREHYRGLKKKAGKEEKWDEYKFFDLYQTAFKILQNALYGTYAINSWRFTDGYKICSASITNSGQVLTQTSINYVNSYISNQLNKSSAKYIIASDTDSMYMELTELLKHRFPDLDFSNRNLKIEKLLILTDELQKKANENLNNISKDLYNVHDKHYFELKQEVIAEKAYWAGKRRYAMYIVNKEGVSVEELDMKGLDIMKSNFPPYFKEFGENIIKSILFDKPKSEIDNDVIKFKNSLSSIHYSKLLKPTGVKKIEEYIERLPLSGEIFSKLKNRTPINSRAAIMYNDFLRFKKLNKKYPEFRIGDKMYIAYLKPNPYYLNVIGYNGYNDPPEIQDFIEKHIDRSIIFESVMKNKLESIYNDLGWDLNLNPVRNKFFNFN
jgi:DNA polymerase elongation subunit (family B)